ncbi:Pentatricopeptide repeat-containing protein [Acorus calamus]|uniref:Pentatricopeptide repeat-containing protein n=1 Tax=Acorus calamus TaxID=4465 RepID=A0AAV9CRC4_ACOCL|nr:Pentatricopeptide repeat-containing protein [Acorus calamus]
MPLLSLPSPQILHQPIPHLPTSLIHSSNPWSLRPTRKPSITARASKTSSPPKELVPARSSTTLSVEKGKYSYDVETLINKLSGLPPRGSIARCLDAFRSRLSLSDFSLVFKEFSSRGDWQRSLRLFKYMQRQPWCRPNEHIYSILISLLGRGAGAPPGDSSLLLDKCLEIFEEMPSHGVTRGVASYTALINAYGRNGRYRDSLELLERMKWERVVPGVLTYNTVINACARGGLDWEGLLGLFAQMRHEGVQPDLVTYNTLLAACGARGLADEAEMVFLAMNEAGVAPDVGTHAYLVETFQKLGRLERVSELVGEMEAGGGGPPDAASYNVLVEAYARAGKAVGAVGVLRQMQAAGCSPNAATYGALLGLYGEQGRYDDARELFLEMKAGGAEPDASTYNILIRIFGEGGYFKEVVTLFHDMVEENVEPNMETYEGVIFACGKGGLYDDAKKILAHMNHGGVVPSSRAYDGVVEAYGQAALYEEALVAFNTMHEIRSTPTLDTYNSLIGTFARSGLYKECEAILWRMNESGVQQNSDSYTGLIEAYCQGGQFEESLKTYLEMQKSRCSIDQRALEAVLNVYCTAGLVDESREQFTEIQSSGVMPSVISYSMLLSVYARNDRWDDAYDLLEEMKNNRVSNTHRVIGSMIKGDYDDESNWQMVEYVFDSFNSEGCGFGVRFYNALLEALWWLNQKARAARVLHEAEKRGYFPELYRQSKLVWSVDVHRMSIGGALTAISVWLNNIHERLRNRDDLPQLAAVVVVRGEMERSPMTRGFPIAGAAYAFLKDNVSPSFNFPAWNRGRIICQRTQLKKLSSISGSSEQQLISINNSPFPRPGTKVHTTAVNNGVEVDRETRNTTSIELMATEI